MNMSLITPTKEYTDMLQSKITQILNKGSKKKVNVGLLAAVAMLGFSPLNAATYSWANSAPTPNPWNVPANWSSFTVPTASDDALVYRGVAAVTDARAVLSLKIGGNSFTGQVDVNSGGSLTSLSSIIIGYSGGGTLNIFNGGSVTANGIVTLTDAALLSSSALNVAGKITTQGLAQGFGTVQVNFDGGTLQANQNNANFIDLTSPFNVLAGGATIDSQSFNIGTQNTFSGVGALNKIGSGRLTLDGNSSCNANALEGILEINGLLQGNVNVSLGAILKGIGTIGSLNNAGTVAPGNSIGTLTVNGNYINSGILENEINAAGQTDLLQVLGSATLNGGTLQVVGAPGNYVPGTQYTVLTAQGGVSGTFSTLTSNLPIRAFLTYLPNSLILNLGDPIARLNSLGGNARRVANYINAFPDNLLGGDFATVLSALVAVDPEALSGALDQLIPVPFQAVTFTAADAAHLVTEGFTDRLAYLRRFDVCCDPCHQGGVWISGVADFLRQSRTDGLRQFAADTQGISLGYDRCLCHSIVAGIGAAYTHSKVDWKRSFGHVEMNSGYFGAYASKYTDCYYVDGALLGFVNHNRANRHIHFSNLNRHAKSHYSSYGINPHIGAGLFFDLCGICLTPYIEQDYFYVQQNKIHECGARSLDLRVKSNHSQLLRFETGVNFSKCYTVCCGDFIPTLSLGYVADWLVGGKKYRASFDNASEFSTFGTDHCFNQFEVGFDVTYVCNDRIAVNVGYEAELGKKRRKQELNLNINYKF